MSEPESFRCARCGDVDGEPLGKPPFATDLGRRVAEEVCSSCWDDWKDRQMLLINHYGIDLQDREARSFLMDEMRAFLLGEGESEATIDTSREGEVDWSDG